MPISYVGDPSKHRHLEPYLRRVKENQTVIFLCYSPAPHWVFTHYSRDAGLTFPCLAERELNGDKVCEAGCIHCATHEPERARGYIFGYNHGVKRAEFLEITIGAWRIAGENHADLIDNIRGMDIELRRGNGKKAHVWAKLTARPNICRDRLPADRLPTATLVSVMRL